MSKKYTIPTNYSPRIIEQSLDAALKWADNCCEHDEEQWFVTDEGAREVLGSVLAEIRVTREMSRRPTDTPDRGGEG